MNAIIYTDKDRFINFTKKIYIAKSDKFGDSFNINNESNSIYIY